MVSKQFTVLSMLMPVAMSIGVLISIFAYKHSQYSLSIVTIISIALLIIIVFYTYGNARKRA